jgi:hypothetical protein
VNAVVNQPPKSAYDSLKRREQRFVDAYVPGRTGAEAMRLMGYKGSQPERRAWRWLQRPEIAAAVEEREQYYLAEMAVRAERILRETMAIATADPRKLVWQEGEQLPVWTEANIPRYGPGDERPEGMEVGDIMRGHELGQPRVRVGDRKALQDLDDATAAALAGVDVEEVSTGGRFGMRYKYKFWDKNKALDKLGQFRKLWDAKQQTVNVDARSVTNNTVNVGGVEAVRSVADLGRAIATIGASQSLPLPDPNGSLLPAPVRAEPQGRGTPVDAGADSGSPA